MMRRSTLCLFLVVTSASAQLWLPPVNTPTSATQNALSMLAGDIDGDGLDDLVVRYNTGTVRWYKSLGNGAVMSMPHIPVSGGNTLRVLDVDADGDVDIVCLGANDTTILRNQGGGNFVAEDVTTGIASEIGDRNGDGYADILTAWDGIFHGNASGGFDPARAANGLIDESLALNEPARFVDITGDGIAEILRRLEFPQLLNEDRLYRQRAGGRWEAIQSWSMLSSMVSIPGDFDGDGRLDLVQTQSLQNVSGPPPTIDLVRNLGDGTFGPLETIPQDVLSAHDYVVADFTGDGIDDLCVAITVFPAFTSGFVVQSFAPGGGVVFELTSGSSLHAVAADVDGDGIQDLARLIDGAVQIYRNAAPSSASPWGVEVVSGHLQSTVGSTPWPQPIVARVVDRLTGTPVSGVPVTFETPSGTLTTPATVLSDANGLASAQITATSVGYTTVSAATGPGSAAIFHLVCEAPLQLVPVDPGAVAVDQGEPVHAEFRLTDSSSGLPVSGANVTFTTVINGTTTMWTVPTDNAGIATASYASQGFNHELDATSAGAEDTGTDVVHRHLDVSNLFSTNLLVVSYTGDAAPVQLTLAADAAATPPLTTPFGVVATSILAPAPTLQLIDGLGLHGPVDPTGVARPRYYRVFSVPAAISGTPMVFQIYGYDPSRPYPHNWIVSNPVYTTLP